MSDDLFQITESQDVYLRRSQRLKTQSQSLFNMENKIPMSQRKLQKTKNEAPNNKTDIVINKNCDFSLEKRTPTPDFSALIAASQKTAKQNDYGLIGFNVLQGQENFPEKISQAPLNLCIPKRQEEMMEHTQQQLLTQQQSDHDKEKTQKNVQVEVPTTKVTKRSQSKATFAMNNNVKITDSIVPTANQTSQPKRKRLTTAINKQNPLHESTTKPAIKRRKRINNRSLQVKSNSIATTTLDKSEYEAPKIIRYHNSCPTMTDLPKFPYEHNPMHQSLLPPVYPPHFVNQIVMSSTPIKTEPGFAYDAPISNLCAREHETYHEQLPPLFHSSHFSNENVEASTIPTLSSYSKYKNPLPRSNLPISLLTPDSSEIIVIENSSEEHNNTPSTPTNSLNSLENFFQPGEINDVDNINKTAYILTELQISALAFVLNISENVLYSKLDEIVEMNTENLMQLISYGKNYEDDKHLS